MTTYPTTIGTAEIGGLDGLNAYTVLVAPGQEQLIGDLALLNTVALCAQQKG